MDVQILVRMGVVVYRLDLVFHPLGLMVCIVPLTNILVNVIPRGLKGAVVMRYKGVLQEVDWGK